MLFMGKKIYASTLYISLRDRQTQCSNKICTNLSSVNDDSCKIIIFSWGEMVNLLMDALVIRLNKISINQLLIILDFWKNSYNFPNQLTTVKESIISSDPPCKDDNAWFTMVPLKGLTDQVWIRTSCICFWKLLFWYVLSQVTCAFLAYMKDWNF